MEIEDTNESSQSGQINRSACIRLSWRGLTTKRECLKPGNTKRRVRQTTRLRRGRGRFLWFALRLLLAFFLANGMNLVSAQGSSPNEYAVKAAFLFHFAQFVEWPEGTFREATSPLVYCTIGADPFHGALETSLLGKKMGGHEFQVRHAGQISEIQGCHVLFVGEGEKAHLASVLASVKGPVMTVGESKQFVNEGGMIAFCLEENKIRFDINQEAAEKANLKISARLLALARTVIGKPKRD